MSGRRTHTLRVRRDGDGRNEHERTARAPDERADRLAWWHMRTTRKERAADLERVERMMPLRRSMMTRHLELLLALPALALAGYAAVSHVTAVPAAAAVVSAPVLRVCADPNNLPFSNEKREGFENRIAEVIARDLGARVEYTWWAQRRGYIRNSLRAGLCDVMIGVPTGLDPVLVTRPYYRSTYAFVSRASLPRIDSFDDPRLKRLRVGVQIIGDDFANAPPAAALSNRGIIRNVRGYSVLGDYREPNPPSRIVRAVSEGEIDIAVVWGPLAGYFAQRSPVPLRVVPVSPEVDVPYLPFVFDIAMGVRRTDTTFRNRLDAVILHRQKEIDGILARYGVPRADTPPT